MTRFALILLIAASTATAAAQSSDGTTDRSEGALPDALTLGVFHYGNPGSWVNAAIARHNNLIDRRVDDARSKGQAGVLPSSGTTAGGSSSGGTVSDLLGSFGGLGNIGNLFDSFTGGSSGTSTSTGNTSTTGTNSELSSLEQLIALRDANTKPSNAQTTTPTKTGTLQSNSATTPTSGFGGAIARLPKVDVRLQATTTSTTSEDEEKFITRWTNAMLSSVFTALTFGLQTNDFIDGVKSVLEPLFFPTADATDGGTDGSGSSGDGETDNGDTSDSSGDGIEDVDDSTGDGEPTDSII